MLASLVPGDEAEAGGPEEESEALVGPDEAFWHFELLRASCRVV